MRPQALLIPYLLALVGLIVLANRGELPPLAAAVYKIPYGDWAAHLGLAAVLSLLAERATGRCVLVLGGLRCPLGAALAALALGLEECSQMAIPARVFSAWDLMATLTGCALGWILAARQLPKLSPRPQRVAPDTKRPA